MDSLRPLIDWIAANGGRPQFAKAVGCTESHLADILNGKKRASLRLAVRMSRACGGAVAAEAFDMAQAEAAE